MNLKSKTFHISSSRKIVNVLLLSAVMSLPTSFASAERITSSQSLKSTLKNSKGETVGELALFQVNKRDLRVIIKAAGLSPGNHGIHFHENGKCEGPDFKSAGGHFKAAAQQHGLNNPKGPHFGDLPNLEVKDDGSAKLDTILKRVSLQEGANSLLKAGGTSLIVHAKSDDQHTEPSGDSGDRIACATIERM